MKKEYHVQYLDPFSLLLVDRKGSLQRVYCPFQVICTIPVGDYRVEERLWVEMVKNSGQDRITYIIKGIPFPYSYFEFSFG